MVAKDTPLDEPRLHFIIFVFNPHAQHPCLLHKELHLTVAAPPFFVPLLMHSASACWYTGGPDCPGLRFRVLQRGPIPLRSQGYPQDCATDPTSGEGWVQGMGSANAPVCTMLVSCNSGRFSSKPAPHQVHTWSGGWCCRSLNTALVQRRNLNLLKVSSKVIYCEII